MIYDQSEGTADGGKADPTSDRSVGDGLHHRLSELVAALGSTAVAANAADVSEASIGRWCKGPTMPPFDKVAALCLAAGFHVDWIATGAGPRDIRPVTPISLTRTGGEQRMGGMVQFQEDQAADAGMVLLPRLNIEASAGRGIIPADEEIEDFLAFKVEFLRHLGINPRNAHVLSIRGNSMYPTIRDRDVIIIDASLIEVLDEGVYTLVYDGAVLAKRLQPLRDGSVVISSDNKDEGYLSETVPASERHTLKIVGRVRGLYRNF